MRQNLVLWGEIATDRKALLAIHLDEIDKKVTIHAFPKNELTDEVRDQLFNVWKNGGEYEFPAESFNWEVDAEGDFSLPENIKLDRPQLLVRAQKDWMQRVQHAEIMKLLQEEVNLVKLQADGLTEYSQDVWNEAKTLWNKVRKSQKEYKLPWEKVDELKAPINHVFDALKAFKRLSNEQSFEESLAMSKVFEKRIEVCKNDLIYPDQWNKIFNDLKLIQKDMKENQLKWKHRRQLRDELNDVFGTLRKYRKVENEKRSKDRINHLKKTLTNMRSSIERDKENYTLQVDRMKHYTRGKMSDEEIEKGLKSVKDKIKSKEKKVKDIAKTIKQIQKKAEDQKLAEQKKKHAAEEKESARKLAEEEKKKAAAEKESEIIMKKDSDQEKEEELAKESASKVVMEEAKEVAESKIDDLEKNTDASHEATMETIAKSDAREKNDSTANDLMTEVVEAEKKQETVKQEKQAAVKKKEKESAEESEEAVIKEAKQVAENKIEEVEKNTDASHEAAVDVIAKSETTEDGEKKGGSMAKKSEDPQNVQAEVTETKDDKIQIEKTGKEVVSTTDDKKVDEEKESPTS